MDLFRRWDCALIFLLKNGSGVPLAQYLEKGSSPDEFLQSNPALLNLLAGMNVKRL